MRVSRLKSTLLACALLAPALLAACSTYNPFGGAERGYLAPRRLGRGECSSEVLNLSGRALEVRFFLGLENPPRLVTAWPRLGVLEPLKSSVLRMDCEHRRLRIRAYATGPVDPRVEDPSTGRDIALVEGRRDVIRLRLERWSAAATWR